MRPSHIRASALACALSALSPPRGAAGQTAQAAGIEPSPPDLSGTVAAMAVAGAALSLLPAGLGLDVAAGPAGLDRPRLVLAWPFQLPLPPGGQRTTTAAYTHHRLVVAPALAFGAARAPDGREAALTFQARAGYRYVVHPRAGSLGLLAGLGALVEFFPQARPALSPEVGLHLGACCDEATGVLTVIARLDAFPAGDPPLRLGAAVGWAFY